MAHLESRVSGIQLAPPVTSHPCRSRSSCTGVRSEEGRDFFRQTTPLHKVLETVHERVAKNEIEGQRPPTRKSMLASIAKFTTLEIAQRVLSSLEVQWNGARITRFRSSVVYALICPEIYCPVVEWIENDDTEVVMFFNIGSPNAYSWLAHYGILTGEKGQGRWSKTHVEFLAESMGYLKVLFEAAQHLAGVLAWHTKDIVRLYCRIPPKVPESNEE
jgi:hypothetical protein